MWLTFCAKEVTSQSAPTSANMWPIKDCEYRILLKSKTIPFSAKNASIIIFHARDDFGQLPRERQQDQLYAFFVLESPVHASNRYKQVPRDFFNISITYRADSDVVYAYDTFESLNGTEAEEEDSWTDEEVGKWCSK